MSKKCKKKRNIYATEALRVDVLNHSIIMLRNTLVLSFTLKHPLSHCNGDQHEQHYEDDTKQSNHNIAIAKESAQFSIVVVRVIGNGSRNCKCLVTILTCTSADRSKR